MSESYVREILRRNVAQICQTIGWNSINSTPLEILTQVLERYIQSLATQTSRYAEHFNRTDPNLNDLGLVFRDLNVHLPELADYVRCVPPVPPPVQVDSFPIPKESNLNFLKPGSHEVVTRPMHVHEHLPPMYPEKEQETPAVAGIVEVKQNGIDNAETSSASTTCTSPELSVTDSPEKLKDIFKRPNDPVTVASIKKPRLRLEEEERTREISSVMMTMSGFISPAREGKLPEASPPATILEKHDKHPSSHTSGIPKDAVLDKTDKKSKKNKILNGKIMKSKRKDKSHKGESSKSKDSSKLKKHPSDHRNAKRSKVIQDALKQLASLTPEGMFSPIAPVVPPPIIPVPEPIRGIKQEPIDPVPNTSSLEEDTIPVPRKIPISKSPLVSAVTATKTSGLISSFIAEKEFNAEDEKLTSQPDRSKINIFKKISNKSKEDKNAPEIVSDSPHPDTMISKLQNTTQEKNNKDSTSIKSGDATVNNNEPCAVDYSKEMDLRTHEVISIDDDSLDTSPALHLHPEDPIMHTSASQSLKIPHSKDLANISPKLKREKKHKDKKDKSAKLEAKLIKRQQQQLAARMVTAAMVTGETDKKDWKKVKPPKQSRPKKEKGKLPPGFPFFSGVPGPGLIPDMSNSDFLAGLANNPALRGLPPSSLLTNPFALGASGPGLIPGPGLFPGSGLHSPLMNMSNYPPRSSSSVKIPNILRRPSLEVIPVDDERTEFKPELSIRDKDRRDKHKSPTIPNILQKHKSNKHQKEHKSNLYKMPLVQPDITIQLNPPKREPVKREPPTATVQSPPEPIPQVSLVPPPAPAQSKSPEVNLEKTIDHLEKKKEKSHKKEKKDKDGLKIKKKKDKKDKNKDKSEKKKDKDDMKLAKNKIKKEKKEKKKDKEKSLEGIVPKLTLKLGSSNSNSPMPPSPPDVFKLNIKPVVKTEEEKESSLQKVEPVSREHSRSPELAQISALVTRPPKQKHSKHNNSESEPQTLSSPPLVVPSPPRKNRPPSSHSKYKRILFKPLSKKGHFDDETASTSEEAGPSGSGSSDKLPPGPLPTPYYVDEHGNKVWVCPACVRPDNGSPMIGCDGCDGWYHWVCVGITEEPGATEDWFCKSCLAKRTAMVLAGVSSSSKKRGRKPKGEKIRDCN